jgi:hypothetical protein
MKAASLSDSGTERVVVDRTPRQGEEECAMSAPFFIEIARRRLKRDVLAARGAQLAASRGAERPPLLELSDGCRSATERTAAGPLRPTTELIKRNCSTRTPTQTGQSCSTARSSRR